MAIKDKIILIIIFAFIIFIFITKRNFISFAFQVDLDKCYNDKRCNFYLSKNFRKE